jgi:IPT/TIG domain
MGQSAGNSCAKLNPKLVFQDTTNGMRLIYHVPKVDGVSAAWLEVWDRPKRLFRTAVPVKTDGQIIWDPDDPYPTTPEMLSLAIYDAELPEFCIDNPCSGPSFGSYVSPVVVGNTTSESSGKAELEGPPIRLVEGGDVTDVIARGRDLPPDMKVILVEKDDTTEDYRWIFRDYLNTETIDLRHIKVTVPSAYLLKPGLYGLVGQDASFEMDADGLSKLTPEQELYVVSKDSPVISSVEPSSVRSDAGEKDDIPVTLRGTGFTKESRAVFGTASSVERGLGGGDADFVSSQEIRAKIPSYLTILGPYANNEPIRVWVTDDNTLKISEPREIAVVPAPSQKAAPMAAAINSVTPFLIPLMDAHSPKYQIVEIEGENFRSDDRVVAVLDPDSPGEYSPLKTEFITETKLRAWLPREFWRKHQLSYRLLLKTAAGVCATEVFDEVN